MDFKDQILERLISRTNARVIERGGELQSRQVRALAESIAEELALIWKAAPALVERDIEKTISLCPVCGEIQEECPSGLVCKNGHGF